MLSKAFLSIVLSWFGRPLAALLFILFFGWLFPQSFWWQYWLMYSLILLVIYYKYQSLLKTFKQILFIGAILILFHFVNKYFIFGTIIIIIALIIYRLRKDIKKDNEGKSLYMTGIRDIEKRLFGKSLDKNNWRKK